MPKPPAIFPGAVVTDGQLMLAANRLVTSLGAPMTVSDTAMLVLDTTLITINMLLSIDAEIVAVTGAPLNGLVPIQRGFDSTVAASHSIGAPVSGFVDAWHHNACVSEIEAIEAALGANLSHLNLPLSVPSYNFPAQCPPVALVVGINTITLSPVPPGVNWTDQNHYLWVSGGSGTPEAVLIVGGNAIAGAASGQLQIQCANAHPVGWCIQSSSSGIFEAWIANPNAPLQIPPGTYPIYNQMNFGKADGLAISGVYGATKLVAQSSLTGNMILAAGDYSVQTTATNSSPYVGRWNANVNSISLQSNIGVNAGDFIFIYTGQDSTYHNSFSQICEVASVSGLTLTVFSTIKVPFGSPLTGGFVAKLNFLNDFSVKDLVIDMQGYGQNAVHIQAAQRCIVRDMDVRNCVGNVNYGSSVVFQVGYKNFCTNINSYNSGSSGTNDIAFYWQTGSIGSNWVSDKPVWGPGLYWSTNCMVSNVVTRYPQGGRCFKLAGSCWSALSNFVDDGATVGTGFSLTSGSYRNVITNVLCTNNHASGFWLSDLDECFNVLGHVISINNTAGGLWDFDYGPSDHDNSVRGFVNSTVSAGGVVTVYDGTNNNYIETGSEPRTYAYVSAAPQAIPVTTLTEILFDATLYDIGGVHTNTPNPGHFNKPVGMPGLYEFDIQVVFDGTTANREVIVFDCNGATIADSQPHLAAGPGLTTVINVHFKYFISWNGCPWFRVMAFSGAACNVLNGQTVTFCCMTRIG